MRDEAHMRHKGVLRIFLATMALSIALAGCAEVRERIPARAVAAEAAQPIDLDAVRFAADASPAELVETIGPLGAQPSPKLLALSGGAEDGAFGAGVLVGWSETGGRPAFDVVTGVSTGAFIAPFALLGPRYDDALTSIYTGYGADDLVVSRGLRGVLGEGLYDTAPLQALIERYVTDAVVDEIAAAHRDGRRLLVVTTDLDVDRAIVWNLGALADLDHPDRYALFRQILLASASIPGFFPPVLIDGIAEGRRVQEIHVDGGAIMQVLIVPERLLAAGDREGVEPVNPAVYVLVNNSLTSEQKLVESSALSVAERSFSTFIRSNLRSTLIGTLSMARQRDVALNVAAVEPDFTVELTEPFDQAYMTQLFAYAREKAVAGTAWKTIDDGGVDRLLWP